MIYLNYRLVFKNMVKYAVCVGVDVSNLFAY